MTRDGSFKRAVRRHAASSNKTYTQALTTMRSDEFDAQTFTRTGTSALPAHLEARYGIRVASIKSLEPHGDGVIRIDRHDGPAWIARVFSKTRHMDRVEGDVALLRYLDEQGFPAERLAHPEPVSVHEGQPVVVTEHVSGEMLSRDARGQGTCAEMLGRLHTLPVPADMQEGGAMGSNEGRPSRELESCRYMLDLVPKDVTERHRPVYDALREIIDRADGCDGLPEAVTHSNLWPGEIVVTPDGAQVVIDWSGNGRGPRLSALANLLWAAGNKEGGDDEVIEAIVEGYRKHVRLEPEELDRLGAAMCVRSTYYACWRYWRIGGSGPKRWDDPSATPRDITAAIAKSWPEEELAHAIAAKVRAL